jgi:signal peptide peptidase SppA
MSKLNLTTSCLWFGTEESYYAFEDAQIKLSELQARGDDAVRAAIKMAGGGSEDDPYGLPPLWENRDGVAVMSIQGSLISGAAGFWRLFGVVGYDDIQEALGQINAAREQGLVKGSLLMSIDSGGGHVDGVEDAGEAILQMGKSMHVLAHTGGMMASAAYWLGASADKVYGAKTSQSGSVGTLIVHMERSQQLKDNGVGVKVIRSGKFKALANSVEKLSADGEEHLQNLADEAGQIFVDYISSRRGMTAEKFQATAGEGRVFMGRQAQQVGLLDGVMNFKEAFAKAKLLDKPKTVQHNPRNPQRNTNMKATLASSAVLAIMAGAAATSLDLTAPQFNSKGVTPDAEDLEALKAEANALVEAREKAKAAVLADAQKELSTKLQAATDEVGVLQGKITVLEAATTELTGKVTASNEMSAKMATVVKNSIAVMAVALNATDTSAGLVGDALMAEHERLGAMYKAKFPVGGVAALSVDTTPKTAAQTPPAAFLARLPKQAA